MVSSASQRRRNSIVGSSGPYPEHKGENASVLQHFAEQKQWSKVLNAIKTRRISDEEATALLFTLCSLNPPLRTVDKLIDAYPHILGNVEQSQKKSALHVACEYGASPYVIDLLVEKNEEVVMAKDNEGKLPLHRACESFVSRYVERKSDGYANEDLCQALEILLGCKAGSILEEDENKKCAIEHAILAEVCLDAVVLLQKTAEKARKMGLSSHQYDEDVS